MFRHVLPNVAPSIIVVASLQFSSFIVAEAAISFLGFGVQPPTPAWGSMLSESRDFLYVAWWLAAFLGAALALTALGVNSARRLAARHPGSEAPGLSMSTSHFFAYLSRMKFIRRWGLMHSTYPENIQEHSLRVAQIAHALAIIRNRLFGGDVSPERAATLALYHDTSEVLTGDLPSPVKEFNPEINRAYHAIEAASKEKLFALIPDRAEAGLRAVLPARPAG